MEIVPERELTCKRCKYHDRDESQDLCPDCLEELRDFLDGAQLNDPLEERQIGFKTQADPYNHLMKRFTRKE